MLACTWVTIIQPAILDNHSPFSERLTGLMVKAYALGAADPGFDSSWRRPDFYWSGHTSNLYTGTPVVTLLDACRCRVNARTCWPGVSKLTGCG